MSVTSFIRSALSVKQIETERSRLEAFLSAFPGAYCGFGAHGLVAYNPAFLTLTGLKSVSSYQDILPIFQTNDDVRFEQHVKKLFQTNENFNITLHSTDHVRCFRVQGVTGSDLAKIETFHVLWFEDISDHHHEIKIIQNKLSESNTRKLHKKIMLDHAKDPKWLYNQNGRIILCNKAYEILVQDTQDNILSTQKEINFIKKAGQQNLKDIADHVRTTNEQINEQRFLNVAGERRSYDISLTPIENGYVLA